MADLAISQVTISAVVVMVMQWLKNSKYMPWITGETDKLNKALAALLAAFTAVGIHFNYDATGHTLMITNLTFGAFVHGGWHWLQSFSFQELIYKGVIKPAPTP